VSETVAGEGAAQLDDSSNWGSAPPWLRSIGLTAWLFVGLALVAIGLTELLGLTWTIVGPVIAGAIVATVGSPIVSALERHRVPRAAGSAIVLLGVIAIAAVIVLLVLGGLMAQSGKIGAQLTEAAAKIQSWIQSLGVGHDEAQTTNDNVSADVSAIISTLARGVANTVSGIASVAFGLSFSAFATFMLLKDGPKFRSWLDRRLGVPLPTGRMITGHVVTGVRRYFIGVTIVAGFNAVVVTAGALILNVPLAGTIGVVTLVTAYVPFIGAIVSGAFAVLLALGSQGTATALIMLVIVILANGALQNIVQPIAMGAVLSMNPLLILVVTISVGVFFGTLGMMLAAPLTSAVMQVSKDLGRARRGETLSAEPG
jgi:predicted PurR-regulated permease PerM